MTKKYQLLWTLDDYRRFLQHPDPWVRRWAADRIEAQYPQQAVESLAGLLTDPDTDLQITAARLIGDSGDKRYEPALLAVWPESRGFVRNWLTTALGQLRSPGLLPHLAAELEAAPAQAPSESKKLALFSVIEALGYYPDEVARSALWQFVERYQEDDRLTYIAFQGLLRFASPAALPRLAQRYGQLKPHSGDAWEHAVIALAEVTGVDDLSREIIQIMATDDPDEVLWLLDDWLQDEVGYSENFEDDFYGTALFSYAGLLPHILAELERVVAERGDELSAWLAAWQSGARPDGYRWRMLYAHHLITALVEQLPSQPARPQEVAALGLALLGQALLDQDDQASLQVAPNELIRQAVLLSILGSTRPNVMPEVVEQAAALGPGLIPHLLDILEGDHFWATPRSLAALTQLARAYPGAADAAIPAILDLINNDESDYILDPAGEALLAIGPAVIAPAAARLGHVDFAYDIYVCYVLANIPTEASLEALLSYIDQKQLLEEYDAQALADLGHPAAIPFLINYYEPGDPMVGAVLYTLSLLNDYQGPKLAEWRAVALDYYASLQGLHPDDKPDSPTQNGAAP